jgi:hypothetical protein
MAFIHSNVTVGTVAQLVYIVPSGQPATQVTLQNQDAQPVFIGDSTITVSGASRGHAIAANGEHTRLYYAGDRIFAISAAGTVAGGLIMLYNTPTGS